MTIKEFQDLVNKGYKEEIDYSGAPGVEGYHTGKLMALMFNLAKPISLFVLNYHTLKTSTDPMDRAIAETVLAIHWKTIMEELGRS